MVLWMNNDIARAHLLEKGFVYSRRPKRRHRENCYEPLFYKEFAKKGTVWVEFIPGSGLNGEIIDSERMGFYLNRSGFYSMKDWDEAAKDSKFMYFIEMQKTNQKETPT